VDKEGLRPILESKIAGVTVFERDKAGKAEVDAAIRAKKRDFDLSQFNQKVR
jgi:hypothetical protein